MSVPAILALLAAGWVVVVAFGWLVLLPWLNRGPGEDPMSSLLWHAVRVFTRVWHRVQYQGTEHLPRDASAHDGLLVVSNHTGAVDPVLIQAGCNFWIRWMMAQDMMGQNLDWLWKLQKTIPVDRDSRDARPLREALRHLRAGGAIGIFPEGRITTPPRELRPFLLGVGLLVAKTKVPVLLAWVSGTPDTNKMGASLGQRSDARVVYVDRIDFGDERDAEKITEALRSRLAEVSGWPLNDEILPPGGPRDELA